MHVIQRTIGELIGDGRLPLAAPSDTVADAMKTWKELGCAAVVVADAGVVVGIFTERDLLYKVAATGRKPSETPVSEVMTGDPRVLRTDDAVTYAINRMAVMGFSNIPIVDKLGRPIALLGVREVLAHLDDVFGDLEDEGTETSSYELDEWVDHGGG